MVTFGASSRKYIVSIALDKASIPVGGPNSQVITSSQKDGQTSPQNSTSGSSSSNRVFNPLAGSSSDGLNAGGRLASVLAMIEHQKQSESSGKRKDREESTVAAYTRKESVAYGQGLESMAARAERDDKLYGRDNKRLSR